MIRSTAVVIATFLLGASVAHAGPDAGVTERATLVVMDLEFNPGAAAYAPSVTQALAHRLSQTQLNVLTQKDLTTVIDRERQATLLGCSDAQCLAELGDAMGARFIVSGRVDQLASRFIVAATVWDGTQSHVVHRGRADVGDAEALLAAAEPLADELAVALGLTPPRPARTEDSLPERGFNLSLKLGTQFFAALARLAPQVDVELAYRLSPRWSLLAQISAGLALGATTTVTLTPGFVGARFNFRPEAAFQPFLGAGLGLFSTLDALRGRTRPSVMLLGGAQYFFWPRFGLTLQAHVDLLGAAFDFIQGEAGGLNLGLSFGVLYRF